LVTILGKSLSKVFLGIRLPQNPSDVHVPSSRHHPYK
jgi:hypothetical protein